MHKRTYLVEVIEYTSFVELLMVLLLVVNKDYTHLSKNRMFSVLSHTIEYTSFVEIPNGYVLSRSYIYILFGN